jgi:zinc/manganese transport system substrate-binding protein
MLTKHKKWLYSGIICGLLFSNSAQAALNVFACEPEWAALAKAIGGDRLTVYSATTAMQDPHHIQARPGLIAKARRADLLACSGAELEIGWLPLLLRKSGNADVQPGRPGNFAAADYVEKLGVPEKLDRRLGDVHAEGNPHIHTSPENILLVAAALHQRISELDPDNADYYRSQYAVFEKHWRQKLQQWQQQAASLQGVNIVTHHNYWTYLNHWSGMNVLATLEPVPGVSPSSSHLAKLKKQLSQQEIKMIIHVAYVSERPSRWLAEQTGAPVVVLPATVDYQDGQTLSQWFDEVVQQLLSVK